MDGGAKLGFVGLGVMGEPMAGHLATRCGRPVIAYDLDSAKLEAWRGAGRETASSPAQIMATCDTVFISLPSGEHLEALCRGAGGLIAGTRPGMTLVDLGTSPPGLTRELAGEFSRAGAGYADAPVARTRKAAEEGTLAITVGATEEIFAAILPLLRCFASDVTHCGQVGTGQMVKILNNMIVVETVVALCEAAAVANAEGMDTQTLFDAFSKASADSFALRNHGFKSVAPRQFPERLFSTNYMLKDIRYALDMGRSAGIEMKGAGLGAELLGRASQLGYGEKYWPVVLKLIEGSA